MIKVSEIAEKYKDYEIDEKELEKLLVKPKPKSIWDLKVGDKYWFVTSCGVGESDWFNGRFDLGRLDCGNIFLTKEEAEFEVERRKCEAIMLKYGTRGYESDSVMCFYFINYDHDEKKVCIEAYDYWQPQGIIFFTSLKIAQQCIDEIGEDRLKKYIFNVKG